MLFSPEILCDVVECAYQNKNHEKMINYIDLGETALERIVASNALIRKGDISLVGNRRTKIYGLFSCASGNRMKVESRVLFINEAEALNEGYRPCSHCLNEKYRQCKKNELNEESSYRMVTN